YVPTQAQPSTDTNPLSLHDALPICHQRPALPSGTGHFCQTELRTSRSASDDCRKCRHCREWTSYRCPSGRRRNQSAAGSSDDARSEEHTSELQSRENLVCRLLLEKK